MTELHTQAALLTLHKKLMAALTAHEGSTWKEVRSELHIQHQELPVWVLLYEDADPVEVHDIFRRTVVPFIDLICNTQLSLMYFMVKNGERFHLDYLESTTHILSASGSREALGIWQKESKRHFWMFNATHSGRE